MQFEKKGGEERLLGRSRGGITSKLHAVCNELGQPIRLLLTSGKTSDYQGARQLLEKLPDAQSFLADGGYDANWLRKGLRDRGISPCIPSRITRKVAIEIDRKLYKKRNVVERMFGRIKDWRRIAMRYDRCAHTFRSAIHIACIVIFYLQ